MDKHNTTLPANLESDTIRSPLLVGDSATEFGASMKRSRSRRQKDLTIQMNAVQEVNEAEYKIHEEPAKFDINQMEDIPNKTDKCIDFQSQLAALKKRTETNLPYTLQQVEDVMYLDHQNIIALEFHYYQSDCKYSVLEDQEHSFNENGDFVDKHGNKVNNKFAIEKYQKDESSIHPMSAFDKKDILNFRDSGKNLLKEQRLPTKNSTFMRVDANDNVLDLASPNPVKNMMRSLSKELKQSISDKLLALRGDKFADNNSQMIDGVLALYKVTPMGGMQRRGEVDLNMGRQYFPAKNGNMVLTRSKDKKLVSVTNFNKKDKYGQYFKVLAWTVKLKPHTNKDNFQNLNNSLNKYYEKYKKSDKITDKPWFDELIEVSFVCNNKYVQLIYFESQARGLEEQQAYEYMLEDRKEEQKIQCNSKSKARLIEQDFDSNTKRSNPRKARKYVFFNVDTGEIAFEYGGVKAPQIFQNSNDEEIEIYELGCLVKEIREQEFHPFLCFYFAGDFMDSQLKDNQVMFKYAMNFVIVDMRDLFENQLSNEEKLQHIRERIQQEISMKTQDGYINYYPFNHAWIEDQKFNWEFNMSIATNRKFDQIALINIPSDPDPLALFQKAYYVHGPKFKEMLKVSNLSRCNFILEVPFYQKLQKDCQIRHTRNSSVKDQLFYDLIKDSTKELQTVCIRLDHPEEKYKVYRPNIQIQNCISQPDIWLQFKKDSKTNQADDIFQTIHISMGNQDGILQTVLPKNLTSINQGQGGVRSNFQIVKRNISTFYKCMADTPCLAYNLGESKIVIQNTLQIEKKKKYILKLKDDEKFVCFLQFNQFEDIGFYPKDIRIECCSHFAFLTSGRGKKAGNISKNRINLILVDPFFEKAQVCLFQSNTNYDDEIQISNDQIIQSVVQSTMGKKRDLNFKTYIWSQFADKMVRSKMLRNDVNQQNNDTDHDDISVDSDDEIEVNNRTTIEKVRLILNQKDFIYYITKNNGKCSLIEGNPRDPYIQNHESIFTLKADKCLALSILNVDTFFFMDEQYIVYMLTRNQNNRQLCLTKELTMKEIQRLDFNPVDFDNIIMTEKYVIQGSKIFYLYDLAHESYPEGIFESENLVEHCKTQMHQFIQGPISFSGSSKFLNIYQVNKFEAMINIQLKPDSYSDTLINDYLNWVDMSTFLSDGRILIKIRRRFMVFQSNGQFIDEVDFNDSILNNGQNLFNEQKDRPQITLKKFKEKQSAKKQFERKMTGAQLLMARRNKDPILDFLGNPHVLPPEEPPVPLSHNNKMDMLNMSANNKWFLFYNRMDEQLYLYELTAEIRNFHPEDSDNGQEFNENECKQKNRYHFTLRYVLDFDKTHLFQHMYTLEVDPIEYYRENISQVKINDQGSVSLCFIENLPFIDIGQDSKTTQGQNQQIQCRVIGTIYTPVDKKTVMKSQGFTDVFEFPRDAQENLSYIIETKKQKLDHQINNIRASQSRLPKKLFDYSKFEDLIDDLITLETKKSDYVYAKVYCDDLLLVYCGNYVKYGKLAPNPQKLKGGPGSTLDLVLEKTDDKIMNDMNAQLAKSVEVIKVIETANKYWLQIVTQDHDNNIYQVVTWDFENNIENTIMQLIPDDLDQVGQYVVKGMNQKMNYFLNQHYLTDLEYDIPLRQVNIDQQINTNLFSHNRQINAINDYYNQRKVYIDNQKILGVEKASCLFYPCTRMDLSLWRDINLAGEKPEIINQTCSLQQCNLIIDGSSLFHYFADNSNIIEQIHIRFENEIQNGTLSEQDKTLPLQILNPDGNGRTALFLAVKSQSPQSFECMIGMLENFPDRCVTKMMLQSLSMLLSHSSQIIISFFDNTMYQPPQMQIEQFIPWDDEMENFIFPSHTSIISQKLLVDKMKDRGIDVEMPTQKIKVEDTESQSDMQSNIPKDRHARRSQLRDQTLIEKFDTGLQEGETVLKRVQIEALDFDWIFCGDNAKILLKLLATVANEEVLTKKTIKIFVELMWNHYQKAIMQYILIPYLVYLVSLSLLGGYFAGKTIQGYEMDLDDSQVQKDLAYLQWRTYGLIILSYTLMACFGSLEVKSMFQEGFEYFQDPWNCIDTISLSMNFMFLGMCSDDIIMQKERFDVNLIRTMGAFACFFMWIKVFYWMRLFSSLAYYVKLIQQTLVDSMPFMLMVAIIILSFANFFYVIDRNIQDSKSTIRYYDQYTNFPIIDVIISIYMLGALGDFNSEIYRIGYDADWAMAMFLFATFIICVVFVNMLIAIMGETFAQVSELAEQSGLKEQVVLIADHAWLLDLQDIFKNQRYIILVKPSASTQSQDDLIVNQVKEAEDTIMKRINRYQGFVTKRIDSVDTNTRFQLKYQEINIQNVSKKIRNLDKLIKNKYEIVEEEDQDTAVMTDIQKKELVYLKQKKHQVLNALNLQISGQTLSIDKIQELAMNWMELADRDGNGELDYGEFYNFFSKIESVMISDEEIKQIFDDFDESGNGMLSTEEFARAIYQAILADNDVETDNEEEQ